MVYVRLWGDWHWETYVGPHGMVHRVSDCRYIKRYDADPRKWRSFADEDAADRQLPDRRLFWCTSQTCFGSGNPRRIGLVRRG